MLLSGRRAVALDVTLLSVRQEQLSAVFSPNMLQVSDPGRGFALRHAFEEADRPQLAARRPRSPTHAAINGESQRRLSLFGRRAAQSAQRQLRDTQHLGSIEEFGLG